MIGKKLIICINFVDWHIILTVCELITDGNNILILR